jgi:phosphoribosylaminoimidazolecarboxamide formyltransferase/IMP cyclohydrolase
MPTALLSVWDKDKIVEFATLLNVAGWGLVASGGTARALQTAGLPVTPVAEITGETEMLGGRVKTLHPAIHAGLLARDTAADLAQLAGRGWEPIDLVVVNLYPFEQVVSDPEVSIDTAIENIDIGGVALLRAAAKNYARVTVLSDPADYPGELAALTDPAFRLDMAVKAFALTNRYDATIETYLAGKAGTPANRSTICLRKIEDFSIGPLNIKLYPVQELRYGENPHQAAAFYAAAPNTQPLGGTLLQGKPLSYNNILDLDAAWRAARSFETPTAVVVKHCSPCGIATAPQVELAVAPAIQSDPVSAFGSVIASNRAINAAFVEQIGDLFVECIAAPSFSPEAIAALAGRKNLRALEINMPDESIYELRSVYGGYLCQAIDNGDPSDAPVWQVVTQRAPTATEQAVLEFAWRACQYVKSNAVLLAKGEEQILGDAKHRLSIAEQFHYTVGIGGGQPNRLDCVKIARERAGERAAGSVLASDAFFPFPDGIEQAGALGVTAVVQPGGSIRDQQVIDAANALGIAMVFTDVRHFRH